MGQVYANTRHASVYNKASRGPPTSKELIQHLVEGKLRHVHTQSAQATTAVTRNPDNGSMLQVRSEVRDSVPTDLELSEGGFAWEINQKDGVNPHVPRYNYLYE